MLKAHERSTIVLLHKSGHRVLVIEDNEDAAETLASHEGNCLALASVFVGLARAVGLDARYMDASARVHETEHGTDGFTVTSGHVTALVVTPAGNIGLDFERLGRVVWYRVLDDVEALAHFYNNRGFERLDEARARGAEPDWDAVGRDFERSVAVLPGFARAWSNLGLARASVGREDAARQVHDVLVADVAVGEDHLVNAALPDDPLEVVLGLDRDAVRIARRRRAPPAGIDVKCSRAG